MSVTFLYNCDECNKLESTRQEIKSKKNRLFNIAISDYFNNEVVKKLDICEACLSKLKLSSLKRKK